MTIKIELERASRDPVPWTHKEFNSWNEAMTELLSMTEYQDIMVYPKVNDSGEYTVTIHDGYVE